MDYFALHKDSDFIAHKGGFKYIDKEWVKGKWNYIYDTGAKAAHKVGTTATNASAQARQAMSNAGNNIQNTSRAVALRAGSATAKARQQLATGTNTIASRAKNAAKVVSNTIDTKVTGKSYKKGMHEGTRLITQATAGNISKVNRVMGNAIYDAHKEAYSKTLAGKIDAKKKDKAMTSIIAKRQRDSIYGKAMDEAAKREKHVIADHHNGNEIINGVKTPAINNDPNAKARIEANDERTAKLKSGVSEEVRNKADKLTSKYLKKDIKNLAYEATKYDNKNRISRGYSLPHSDKLYNAGVNISKQDANITEEDKRKAINKGINKANREAAAQKVVDAVVNKPIGAIANAANKVKSDVNEKVLQGVNKLGYSEKERLNMAKYSKDKATEEMKNATSNAIQARKAHNAQQEKSYGENGAVAKTDAARKKEEEAHDKWSKESNRIETLTDKYGKASHVYVDARWKYDGNPTPYNKNRVDRASKEWEEINKELKKTLDNTTLAKDKEKYDNAKREANRYEEAKNKQLSRSLEAEKKYDQASNDLRKSLNNNKQADKSLQYALNLYKDTPLGKLEEKAKTSKTAKKAYDAIMAYMAKQT